MFQANRLFACYTSDCKSQFQDVSSSILMHFAFSPGHSSLVTSGYLWGPKKYYRPWKGTCCLCHAHQRVSLGKKATLDSL